MGREGLGQVGKGGWEEYGKGTGWRRRLGKRLGKGTGNGISKDGDRLGKGIEKKIGKGVWICEVEQELVPRVIRPNTTQCIGVDE